MAGKKRTRYDDESLKELSKKLVIVQEVINDTMNGSSMTESINSHFVNMHQFRRVLDTLQSMQIHDKICTQPIPERLADDFMCTPIEALYGSIFGIQEYEWQEFSMPKDAMESWLYVKPQLTEREQKVIDLCFFEEMTLEEVGKEFNVTRDRIRQILVKALRKLRNPSRSKILKIGIGEWSYQQSVLEEQTRIEREVMEQEFQKHIESMRENTDTTVDSILQTKICELELSVRSYNCLKRAGIDTIKGVLLIKDFTRIRNLGRKSAEEVMNNTREFFCRFGFKRDDVDVIRHNLLKQAEEKYEYKEDDTVCNPSTVTVTKVGEQ